MGIFEDEKLVEVLCYRAPEKPVVYIRQPNDYGCMVAAVAMIIGRSYEETEQAYSGAVFHDPKRPGIGEYEAFSILHEHGFAIERRYKWDPVRQVDRDWPCAPWAPIHLVQLQATAGAHAAVMLADGTVFDPYDPARKSLRDPVYRHFDWVAGVWKVR